MSRFTNEHNHLRKVTEVIRVMLQNFRVITDETLGEYSVLFEGRSDSDSVGPDQHFYDSLRLRPDLLSFGGINC